MKKSTVAIAVVLGFVGVVGFAAAVVAFGYFAVKGIESTPADEHKRLVLDQAVLASYNVDLDARCIKLTSKRNLDRTREIEFTHACEHSDLHITSGAEINPSVRDARQSFALNLGAYRAGVALGKVELQPRDELLPLGDQHYAAIVSSRGRPVGNVFLVRQGRVLHTLFMTGVYFDRAEDVRGLFTPLLEESRRQFP